MASRAYLLQLAGQVFRQDSAVWLETPCPDFPGSPKPIDLIECSECSEMVEDYLHSLSTAAAVERARAAVRLRADQYTDTDESAGV